jgi:hypothetical protein
MPVPTTCRDAVLDAMRALRDRHGRSAFKLEEIVHEVQSRTSAFKESTIRTHVVSRLCSNAPNNHAVVYKDLERVGPGLYRLRGA